ncbi:MAG: hypothetical protein ACXVXN_11870, partial [Mycobacteriaceae bacterium]
RPEPVGIASDEAPLVIPIADGEVTIETATVEYGRDNQPALGLLVGRTADGRRMAGQTAPGDTASVRALSLQQNREVVGRAVRLDVDGAYVRITPALQQDEK